jgi:hypothetical protein
MATTNPYYTNPYAIQSVSGYQPSKQGITYDSGGQKIGMTTAQEAKDFNDKNPSVLSGAPSNPSNIGGIVSVGMDVANLGIDMYQQGAAIGNANIGEMTQQDSYNPYFKPMSFQKQATPEQFSKEASANRTMGYVGKGAGAGAKIGTLIAPGIGTAIGAGAGALIGAGVGLVQGSAAAKKRDEFEAAQKNRYKNYIGAQNTYYDNFDKQNMVSAQNRNLGMRGQNYIPAYNSSIYGFV